MSKVDQWRKQQSVILIDSAMETGLEERHYNLDTNLWTAKALIDAPDQVRDVHRAYFDQGSNVTTTDTYQVSVKGFGDADYSKSATRHYIYLATKLAQEGRAKSSGRQAKFISGSVGPYGAALHNGSEYTGDYQLTTRQYIHFHQDRLKWLIEAGCDLIQICTIPRFDEIQALSILISQYPQVPVIFSCSLKDPHHIADGTDLRTVQKYLQGCHNVIAYGINCCPPQYVVPALQYLKPLATTDQDLIVFPNAGAHYNPKTKTWGKPIPHVYSRDAKKWHQAGAKWIGGCCTMTEKELGRVSQIFKN